MLSFLEAKDPVEAVRFWEFVKSEITGSKWNRMIVETSFLSRAGEVLSHPNIWKSFTDALIIIMGGGLPNEWTKPIHNGWWQCHISGKFYLVYYPRRDKKIVLKYLGSSSEVRGPMNDLEPYKDPS